MPHSLRTLPPAALVLLLAALSMFGPFSIDTMFPAFPEMEAYLHIGPVEMQQTLSVYLLAFAVMALLHGPLSDALGRRPVILAGVACFVLASVGCALATNLWQLLLCRALQGVFAGAGLIVGRAIIRDQFAGADAQRVMSRVTMVFGLAPALAPIVGGLISTRLGWQAIFWFLALFALVILALCWRWLPETHAPAARLPLAVRPLLRGYGSMLSRTLFVQLALSASFNFSALFVYIASAPAFVLKHLHMGATDFGYLFVPVIGGMMAGAFLSGRLAGRWPLAATIRLGYGLMLAGGAVNVAYCLAMPQVAWPWAVLPVIALGVGISLCFPTINLLMMDLYPERRGSVASLQSFLSLMLSAVVAGAIAPWLAHAPLLLALGSLAFTSLGFLAWCLAKRQVGEFAADVEFHAAAEVVP